MVAVRAHDYSTEAIEGLLVPRLEDLCARLAPQGRRQGHEWVALNPTRADHSIGSFSINMHTGRWMDGADAAASSKSLPVLSLISYLATAGDFGKAILWAKDYLGLTGRAPDQARAAAISAEAEQRREARAIQDAKHAERKRRAAQAIWLEGKPLDGFDPASEYLKARGIDVTALAHIPSALRFNPAVKIASLTGKPHAAMVAAMHREGAPDGFAAVHATYLKFDDLHDRWVKAFGKESKKILATPSGAAIRLTRGASGKPLAKAPAGEWVAIAEGIENGLSASIVRPDLRMLAAATLGNIGKVQLPDQIGGVFVIADNDRAGSAGESALENACNALADRGLDIKLVRAPLGYKDFNDALTGLVVA